MKKPAVVCGLFPIQTEPISSPSERLQHLSKDLDSNFRQSFVLLHRATGAQNDI